MGAFLLFCTIQNPQTQINNKKHTKYINKSVISFDAPEREKKNI